MIPSRTIAPACPCFSTSSLAGLHSSVRSKQLIENRISFFLSFFSILNHFIWPQFLIWTMYFGAIAPLRFGKRFYWVLCVCCSLGSQRDLLERGAPAWARPRRTKSGDNTARSDCQCAETASAPGQWWVHSYLVALLTSHPALTCSASAQIWLLELILTLGCCGLWSSGSSSPGT